MCLGVPGRVDTVWEDHGMRMATVDFGGIRKEVCLAYVPEVEVGDYTIVHVGFALTRLDEASARETLELMRSVGLLEQELTPGSEPSARPGPASGSEPSARPGPASGAAPSARPGPASGAAS